MKACAGRQISAADGSQRGQQRILRRRVQRVLAERRQVSDEHHRADGAGEIFHDDGGRKHCGVGAGHGQRAEGEIGGRLQNAADPQAGRQRKRARNEAAGKAAEQQRGKADTFDDGGIFIAGKSEIDHERRRHGARQRIGELEQHNEGQHDEGQRRGRGNP